MSIFSAKAGKAEDVSLALYAAGLVVLLSGILAVAYQMADTTFTTYMLVLTVLGVTTSYLLRVLGVPPRWIKVGALGLCLLLLLTLRGDSAFGNIVPEEARGSIDMRVACALALTATFYSFLLMTDEGVVFTCVFTIALIGLIGSQNVNRELILCFLVFLAAAVFLLVHQNYLQNRPRQGAASLASGLRLLRAQLLTALACGLTAVAIGFLTAVPLQMAMRGLSLAGVIRQLTIPAASVAPGLISAGGVLTFDDPQRFEVGLGPVGDDQTQVLTVELVRGDRPFYWRGRTYDFYTGTGWERTLRGPRRILQSRDQTSDGNFVFRLAPEGPPRGKVKPYVHRFRPRASGSYSLYAAAEPQVVRAPFSQIFHRQDNTIGLWRGNMFGMSASEEYEVESGVSEPADSDLRSAGRSYPPDVAEMYLRQSASGPAYNPDLAALADEATAGFTNPYDKARAIERWVAQRCQYTLEAPAVPRDRDAAVHFLTVTRTGYCDLYATAVVVLCRYAGLPARMATGFIPGTPSPDNPRAYVLRNVDRHAWAEVYFPGYGWTVFDATSETGTVAGADQARARAPRSGFWQQLWARGPLPVALIGLGLMALLYLLKTEVWDRFGPGRRRGGAQSLAGEVAVIYAGAVRRVARRGVARPATMTPGAYVEKVRAYLGSEVADALAALTRLAEQALYGPETVTPAAVESARSASERLRRR